MNKKRLAEAPEGSSTSLLSRIRKESFVFAPVIPGNVPASAAAEGGDLSFQSAANSSSASEKRKKRPTARLDNLHVTPPSPATAAPAARSPTWQNSDVLTGENPAGGTDGRSLLRQDSSLPEPDGLESVPEDDEVDPRFLVSTINQVKGISTRFREQLSIEPTGPFVHWE